MHYDAFASAFDHYGENSSEFGYCGTLLSESEGNSTNDKKDVDCKRCIKLFEKAKIEMEFHSQNFVNDCQQFLDHVENTKPFEINK